MRAVWGATGAAREVAASIGAQAKGARAAHPTMGAVIASARDALLAAIAEHGEDVTLNVSATVDLSVCVCTDEAPAAADVVAVDEPLAKRIRAKVQAFVEARSEDDE